MPNKKVSELPSTTTVSNTDIFVLNRLGTTSTITYNDLSAALFTNIGTTDTVFDSTPIGTINYFAASAAPVGYLECNGAIVLKNDYIDLYDVIKDTYTPVVSANHFKLPDLRGEFIRGWDHGRGGDTGRVFGSWQKGTIFGHDNTTGAYGVVGIVYTGGDVAQSITLPAVGLDKYDPVLYPSIQLASIVATGATTNLPQFASDAGSSGTTRPRNVALLPCIKALKTVNGDTRTLDFIERNDFTGTNQSLTTNGYQKLPGGLIMQWGTVSSGLNFSNGVTITFNPPFPNACTMINSNYINDGNQRATSVSVGSVTRFSAKIYYNGNSYAVYWFAIGY